MAECNCPKLTPNQENGKRGGIGKAMEVVASRLGMEVANLRFLVEKENGQWSRLMGEEKAKDLEGTFLLLPLCMV